MTIDAGWTKTAKRLAPAAFTLDRPSMLSKQRHTVFFDGQIKLMKSEHIRTWVDFLRVQFYVPIQQAFSGNASVVVLGFDDYAHVPVAKTPTQRKRSDHVKALTFEDGDDLPPQPPEEWAGAMRNRIFKTKVVGLIVRNVIEHFKENELACAKHTLIIDWVGTPQVYGLPLALPQELSSSELNLKRGECDVKAFVWSRLGMPLLIESTDGDFVPMSMLQLERHAAQEGCETVPHVFLHRLKTNVSPAKRGTGGKPKREFEYVHVNSLYATLDSELQAHGQVAPLQLQGQGPRASTARLFALLVASTGCDFCLSLPNLGPGKIWAMRNGAVLMPGIARDRRAELWATQPLRVLLHMVIVLYRDAYKKHLVRASRSLVSSPEESMDALRWKYTQIYNAVMHESGLGVPRIAPWPVERMLAHLKNTLWTLHYWIYLHDYPDPLAVNEDGEDMYGFTQKKRGVVFVGT